MAMADITRGSMVKSESAGSAVAVLPQLDGLHRKNGEFRRQWRILKWRARRDSNS
jgi:hypothetical protein